MAWLSGPHEREARIRATRWQHIQVAERQIRDGIVRSTGDPDSAEHVFLAGPTVPGKSSLVSEADAAARIAQRQQTQRDAQRAWQYGWEAQQRAQQQRGR
jgi:hypothetical protein